MNIEIKLVDDDIKTRHIIRLEQQVIQLRQTVNELNVINERLSLRLKRYEDKEMSDNMEKEGGD